MPEPNLQRPGSSVWSGNIFFHLLASFETLFSSNTREYNTDHNPPDDSIPSFFQQQKIFHLERMPALQLKDTGFRPFYPGPGPGAKQFCPCFLLPFSRKPSYTLYTFPGVTMSNASTLPDGQHSDSVTAFFLFWLLTKLTPEDTTAAPGQDRPV